MRACPLVCQATADGQCASVARLVQSGVHNCCCFRFREVGNVVYSNVIKDEAGAHQGAGRAAWAAGKAAADPWLHHGVAAEPANCSLLSDAGGAIMATSSCRSRAWK